MKLTNRKIKNLIRESLQRILFESEERIENLKDQFNLVYQKLSRAKSQEEFDQLNAEAEKLDKEINRLTRTMFKEPKDPGEFDFMQSDPIDYPVPYQSGEMTAYEEDPLDRPARIDVTDGEGNEFSGGPMTQRDMNRRDFMQNVGVGVGASAFLGKQIFDFYKDTTLQDFMSMSEAEKIKFVNAFVDNKLQNMPGSLENAAKDEGDLEELIDDITDLLTHHILKNEKYTSQADDLFDQLQGYVGNRIEEKILLLSDSHLKTIPLTPDMIEEATEGWADEHFDYNSATDVISNGTLDDIELFENNQAVRIAVDYMDYFSLELSRSDSDKLLSAIRSKVDKIMSRLGGP